MFGRPLTRNGIVRVTNVIAAFVETRFREGSDFLEIIYDDVAAERLYPC